MNDNRYPTEAEPNRYVAEHPKKNVRQVPLTCAIASVLLVFVLSVLITFSLTSRYLKTSSGDIVSQGQGETETSPFAEIDVIDKLFRSLTIKDLDSDALIEGVLNGYVQATGDRYAEYYNEEDLEALKADQNGEMFGIGVTVIQSETQFQNRTVLALTVIDINDDSPAAESGVRIGDMIIKVGSGEEEVWADDIGYNETVSRIRGPEGTKVFFTVLRNSKNEDGTDTQSEILMAATRKQVTVYSVKHRVYEADETVGIIRVSKFNNTTVPQFTEAVEALKQTGCTQFVLDLRDNPGGLLTSVEDLATLFLQPNDVILYSRNNKGEKTTYAVTVDETNGTVTSGSGSLKAEDVGKYKGMKMTVLVNGNTASAAELFTANVLYYDLGQVVGTKTYGKGTMQTTYLLSYYGYPGALKLTTQYYDGPSGENYDGIGLTPDETVELSETAQSYILVVLPDSLDNQLERAVALLN